MKKTATNIFQKATYVIPWLFFCVVGLSKFKLNAAETLFGMCLLFIGFTLFYVVYRLIGKKQKNISNIAVFGVIGALLFYVAYEVLYSPIFTLLLVWGILDKSQYYNIFLPFHPNLFAWLVGMCVLSLNCLYGAYYFSTHNEQRKIGAIVLLGLFGVAFAGMGLAMAADMFSKQTITEEGYITEKHISIRSSWRHEYELRILGPPYPRTHMYMPVNQHIYEIADVGDWIEYTMTSKSFHMLGATIRKASDIPR